MDDALARVLWKATDKPSLFSGRPISPYNLCQVGQKGTIAIRCEPQEKSTGVFSP
jgi:hypothetical protein